MLTLSSILYVVIFDNMFDGLPYFSNKNDCAIIHITVSHQIDVEW